MASCNRTTISLLIPLVLLTPASVSAPLVTQPQLKNQKFSRLLSNNGVKFWPQRKVSPVLAEKKASPVLPLKEAYTFSIKNEMALRLIVTMKSQTGKSIYGNETVKSNQKRPFKFDSLDKGMVIKFELIIDILYGYNLLCELPIEEIKPGVTQFAMRKDGFVMLPDQKGSKMCKCERASSNGPCNCSSRESSSKACNSEIQKFNPV